MKSNEWAVSARPERMLDFAWRRTRDERRLRLVAAAAWEVFLGAAASPDLPELLDLAARVADGEATDAERTAGYARSPASVGPGGYRFLNWSAYQAAFGTLGGGGGVIGYLPRDRSAERVAPYTNLLRDIYGDLYRTDPFDPSWRTEAVVGLARWMYEGRDFGPMPVLADALEDAGCADTAVLAHCRGPGPHARGCWVVDLVLEKG